MTIASGQIRQRALAAYEEGRGTQAEIARLYGVDLSTFQRWWRHYRQDGQTEPKGAWPQSGRPRYRRNDAIDPSR